MIIAVMRKGEKMRLIDADVLIEFCAERWIPLNIDAINMQPTIQPETHWIPCSERLPKEGQKCLVCDKGGIGIDTYIGHGNPYNWKWYTRDYEAWISLPEPYRGGEE